MGHLDAPFAGDRSLAHVIVGAAPIEDVIVETTSPGVKLAPATTDLARADLTLASKIGRELMLRKAIGSLQGKYDIALIDTSPYLGLLTVNALVAATHVLIPVSAEYFPMLGLQLLGETIGEVRDQMASDLALLGYVVTMYDRRLGLTNEVVDLLANRLGDQMLATRIRVNANLKSAPAHRKDIFAFESALKKPWKGIQDFEALSDEVARRLATSSVSAEREVANA